MTRTVSEVGPTPQPGYAFGDTPDASDRLDVLAAVFAPTSRALLRSLPCAPALVLDLGCGPGHTSAMVAEAFPGARVVGIDTSPAFVAEAGASGTERCHFTVGDVTRTPLPCAPADLVYARFLLVHLRHPAAVAAAWVGELRPGGVLVLEEPEAIDTADPDFRRYLELAETVVAARGGDLYVGRRLTGVSPPAGAEVLVQREVPLAVTAGSAARIFSLNLGTWRHDPALTGVAGPEETAALLHRLQRRAGDASTGVIRWHMRQVVVTRT